MQANKQREQSQQNAKQPRRLHVFYTEEEEVKYRREKKTPAALAAESDENETRREKTRTFKAIAATQIGSHIQWIAYSRKKTECVYYIVHVQN